MNPVHLHLMLNHAPLFGSVISLLVLLVAIWRRSDQMKRIAFGLLVLSALLTLPVYFTGEPTEEAVEHFPGMVESAIDSHANAATVAFVSMLATGAVALISFAIFRRGRMVSKWFTTTALVMSVITALLMARTANLGGKIRHTEIGSGPVSNTQPAEHNDHDDD